MKVKVTAGELSVMDRPLQDLGTAKMPAGIGYQVARLVQTLQAEVGIVVVRQREIMLRHKAEESEEGDLSLSRANPNFAKAEAELNDLFAQSVTVEAETVKLPKKVILEPATLMILGKFIKVT